MAVTGFDNRQIAEYLQPPLTTISLPTTEIGGRAALHIMKMVNDSSLPPVRDIIRCSIIERESV
jgi:LacI family transcriptional regulator